MHKLEELKEMLCEELEEYGSKDKLDMGGLEIVDKLAHAIKNIDKIIDSEYSERGGSYRGNYGYEGNYGYRGNYGERGSYGEGSYRGNYGEESYRGNYGERRGRGRNARRDSMGRYASADMRQELERLMDEAPDEETRMKLERFMQSM